jgi:hypothetical protein
LLPAVAEEATMPWNDATAPIRGTAPAGSHHQPRLVATASRLQPRRRRPSYHQEDPAQDANAIHVAPRSRRLAMLARLALLPLIFLLGPRLANATIFVTSSAAPLVESADAIALGSVRAVTARWEGHCIVSDVQLDVHATVKGQLPRTITLVAAGGKIGDVVMRVIGGADFRIGDRSIVFMSTRQGVRRLIGLGAGKLDVRTRDGQELVALSRGATTEELPLRRVIDELRAMAHRSVE